MSCKFIILIHVYWQFNVSTWPLNVFGLCGFSGFSREPTQTLGEPASAPQKSAQFSRNDVHLEVNNNWLNLEKKVYWIKKSRMIPSKQQKVPPTWWNEPCGCKRGGTQENPPPEQRSEAALHHLKTWCWRTRAPCSDHTIYSSHIFRHLSLQMIIKSPFSVNFTCENVMPGVIFTYIVFLPWTIWLDCLWLQQEQNQSRSLFPPFPLNRRYKQ